jgi:Arc/MetJ-type ribon-helix-helix transcriptional regulator
MVNGMATRKITITVDEADLERIRGMVAAGSIKSVSGFVQNAVARTLDAERIFDQHLATVIEETGGPLTAGESAWLDAVLGPS